ESTRMRRRSFSWRRTHSPRTRHRSPIGARSTSIALAVRRAPSHVPSIATHASSGGGAQLPRAIEAAPLASSTRTRSPATNVARPATRTVLGASTRASVSMGTRASRRSIIRGSLLHALDVLAGAGVDPQHVALVDEERDHDLHAGLERRGLQRVAAG